MKFKIIINSQYIENYGYDEGRDYWKFKGGDLYSLDVDDDKDINVFRDDDNAGKFIFRPSANLVVRILKARALIEKGIDENGSKVYVNGWDVVKLDDAVFSDSEREWNPIIRAESLEPEAQEKPVAPKYGLSQAEVFEKFLAEREGGAK